MNSNNTYHKRIQRVLHYIENHQDATPSLAELADIANFSPFHFHRVFTSLVGESAVPHCHHLHPCRCPSKVRCSSCPAGLLPITPSAYCLHNSLVVRTILCSRRASSATYHKVIHF